MRRFNSARLRGFLDAQDGATAIEYAIIASGIAGVLIGTIALLGGSLSAKWTTIASIFN